MSYSPLRQLLQPGALAQLVPGPSCSRAAVIIAILVCFVALLDISDIVFAFVGALGYLLCFTTKRAVTQPVKHVEIATQERRQESVIEPEEPRFAAARRERRERKACEPVQHAQEAEDVAQRYKPSVCPVACPSFASADWEGQINEFLRELMPTDETGALARTIACAVQDSLRSAFPNVDVVGFAHGNPKSSKAFATAVPDIEIVARVPPELMVQGVGGRCADWSHAYDDKSRQKAVIRACTDQLAYGDFKFRRSAFKYEEPKVTLLAPATLESMPFDFSVNALTPGRHASLLQECMKTDVRVWKLVLLVHRWARDRGISHAAKGHLTPYAWTLVVLFYLQVRGKGEGALLPPFKLLPPHFQPEGKKSKAARKAAQLADAAQTPVATLFKEFMTFYATQFNWDSEVLSVEKASRVAPDMSVAEWRRQAVGFQICDPFEPAANLGVLLSGDGHARLREELARAEAICSKDGLLSQLLEPWSPPDANVCAGAMPNDDWKGKRDAFPKASAPGRLTASPADTFRPKHSSPGSLTAAPMGFSLRPKPAAQGSLTASPKGISLTPSSKGSLTSTPSLGMQLKPSGKA